MFELTNKVAIITGANQGCGLAVTKRFLAAGCKVVMVDMNDKTEQTAKDLGCVFVKTDVSNDESVKAAFEKAIEVYGGVDIVVNAAGIANPETNFDQYDYNVMKKMFEVNTFGIMWSIKHATKYMNDGGSIINFASLAVISAIPGYGIYSATKGAVVAASQVAAMELAPRGIRVNCIAPTTIDTPMAYQPGLENELRMNRNNNPFGRMCSTDDVAATVHFLAADDCKFINAHLLVLDAGETIGIPYNRMAAMTRE